MIYTMPNHLLFGHNKVKTDMVSKGIHYCNFLYQEKFKRRDNFKNCGICIIIEESDPPGATESTWLVLEELGLDLDATDWDCQV